MKIVDRVTKVKTNGEKTKKFKKKAIANSSIHRYTYRHV